MSTETLGTIGDGEPWTATSTFTQLSFLKMFHWFYTEFLTVVTLATISGTGCTQQWQVS